MINRSGQWVMMLLFILLLGFPIPIGADGQGEQYIVQFESETARESWLEPAGKTDYTLHESINGVSLILTKEEVRQLSRSVPGVKHVVKDAVISVHRSNEPSWEIETITQSNENTLTETGKGVKVSIIDTGIEMHHPNLDYTEGICLIADAESCENGYQDDNGHGTHVAGVVNAQGLDGMSGVAPDAELYVVKAMNARGDGKISDVIAGIEWSLDQEVDIINLSITSETSHSILNEVLRHAAAQDILLVGAAGNVHRSERPVMYPAKHPDVHAIASVGKNRQPSNFSAFGPEIHFAAPGEAILSTDLLSASYQEREGYSVKSGTSMAVPFVSSVMALYMERYPHLSGDEMVGIMEAEALQAMDFADKDPYTGYGIVQTPKEKGEPQVDQVPVKKPRDGKVVLELELLEEGSYVVYRNGIEIGSSLTGPAFTDYVHPGPYLYEVYEVTGDTKRYYGSTAIIHTTGIHLTDVNPSSWYYRDVYYLASADITRGFPDGSFRPYLNLTRAEAVTMIVRALELEAESSRSWDSPFNDVSKESFAYEAIHLARENHIVSGYGDGTFRPGAQVTRAEVAIMLQNAWFSDYNPSYTASGTFTDIHPQETAYKAINTLYENNVTSGFPDGTFRGNENIQRNQYARFLSATAETAQ